MPSYLRETSLEVGETEGPGGGLEGKWRAARPQRKFTPTDRERHARVTRLDHTDMGVPIVKKRGDKMGSVPRCVQGRLRTDRGGGEMSQGSQSRDCPNHPSRVSEALLVPHFSRGAQCLLQTLCPGTPVTAGFALRQHLPCKWTACLFAKHDSRVGPRRLLISKSLRHSQSPPLLLTGLFPG